MKLKTSFTNLATSAFLNTKINEVKGEIPSITNLTTTAALTAIENKIPNISDLIKKADIDAEIKDMKGKYLTKSDYNQFTNNILDQKITAIMLGNESGLNEKKTLATKEEIKIYSKASTYDLSFFIGQSYFFNDGSQLLNPRGY